MSIVKDVAAFARIMQVYNSKSEMDVHFLSLAQVSIKPDSKDDYTTRFTARLSIRQISSDFLEITVYPTIHNPADILAHHGSSTVSIYYQQEGPEIVLAEGVSWHDLGEGFIRYRHRLVNN